MIWKTQTFIYPLISLGIFLLLVVAIATAGYRHYLNRKAQITHDKYAELVAVADLKVDQITKWRNERLSDDLLFLKNPFFSEAVERFLANPESASLRKNLATWLYPINQHHCYHSIVVFDTKLSERLSFGTKNKPAGKLTRELAARVMRSGSMEFSDLHYGESISRIHLDVLIPLSVKHAGTTTLIGVLLVRVDPYHELFPLVQSWSTASPSAETLLVKRVEKEVVYLNELRHRKGTALALRVPLTKKDMPAVQAALGRVGESQGVDYRGVSVFSVTRKIPGTSWFLVAKVDTDEILAPARRQTWVTGAISVLLILLAGTGIGLIWRHTSARTFKKLYKEERLKSALTEHVERLSRMYKTLGHVNQAIVRCSDNQELYDRVCQIVVEDGGLLMAWVGLSDRESCGLKPSAFSGFEEGYLSAISISTDTVPTGLGPSGKAVREGRHVVCGDIETDPAMAPWKEEALRRGYLSSASFPLFSGEGCIGALSVYAARRDFFDDETVALLVDLTEDISFAIKSLERDEELQRSQLRFKEVSEIISDFAYSCIEKPGGSFSLDWMSGAIEEITGYSMQEIMDRGCWKFLVHEADLAVFDRNVTGLVPGRTELFDIRICRKDGSVRWLQSSCKCDTKDSFSGSRRLVGACRDITQHKQAEKSLRRSEERYRNLFENHAAVKLLLDPETGRIVDANQAAAKFYGWSRDQLTQMKIQQINNLLPEQTDREIEKVIENQRIRFEFCHQLADGSVKDVEVYSSKIELEGKEYIHSIIHDISERKQAEKQNKLLISATEQSPVTVIITDCEGTIEYVNRKFSDLTGYSREETVGQNPRFQKSGNQSQDFYDNLWATIVSGRDWHGELVNKKKNGEFYLVNASISPVRDENGNITHFVAVQEDITERKRLEKELLTLNRELETRIQKRTADLESFTSMVSHDLRAPLRAISGFSRILLDDYMSVLDAKGRYLLDSVIENTKRMGQLIDDLLSFSRVERSEIMHSDINMTALAKSVAYELLTADIRDKISIRVESLPDAQGDGSLLRQVWVNLLSNAVKFTLPKESGLIEVGAIFKEREIVYFVKDTGVGFDSRYAHKLFDIFQRLHSAAAFEGTGVGLAIVQRIIERHGGRVWAEGSQGEGATFYFSLPTTKKREGNNATASHSD